MRIIAMSDLHGAQPDIPDGDLLLLGGDILSDRYKGLWGRMDPWVQKEEFTQLVDPWLEDKGIPTFGTWGNHDWVPDEVKGKCYEFGVDKLIEFKGLTIWLSPWSNKYGYWNWMLEDTPEELGRRFDAIPPGTDIIVSHGPPYGYGDKPFPTMPPLGSRMLLEAISRVKPKVVIVGHIHGGYGAYELAGGVKLYNVAIRDEAYQVANPPTIIDIE